MPILQTPDYRPTGIFQCGHIQTIYPTLFRKKVVSYPFSQRIYTQDGDFIDLDNHSCGIDHCKNLAIISHGLEGNSKKKYVLGMASALVKNGWDVICLNFRGCSGEMNLLPRLYHSGVTDDLHRVLTHGLENPQYTTAALIGFSMGGNQTLKYLGEDPDMVPSRVKAAVVFSVPCHLADSVVVMNKPSNSLYMSYFMKSLKEKVLQKAQMFPEIYNTEGLQKMKTFHPFDDKYTGPVHGFMGADDYYTRCASLQFIHRIQTETLLVQAKDDPFLSRSCYPVKEAWANKHFHLEITQYGGHVGFVNEPGDNLYWMEKRAVNFLDQFKD